MRCVFFYHSILSDWNNGNAHFLRGVVRELSERGCEVVVFEPVDGWSRHNQMREPGGRAAMTEAARLVEPVRVCLYNPQEPNLESLLARSAEEADVVVAHEWNEPRLIKALGRLKAKNGFRLLFHDTHHRAVSKPEEMARFDLSRFDGVLAFGKALAEVYLERSWTDRVWVWHEAADTAVFRPHSVSGSKNDLVWIGNWGDDERSGELEEYLVAPSERLGLSTEIYGVRYPDTALKRLEKAGAVYRGWLPNHRAPMVFAKSKTTVHVPRRQYAKTLPGIPTIRVFEALACGAPLVCSYWQDTEGLFSPGQDFLVVENGRAMERALRDLIEDQEMAKTLAAQGLSTVMSRHTCAHRAVEFLSICAELGVKNVPGLLVEHLPEVNL